MRLQAQPEVGPARVAEPWRTPSVWECAKPHQLNRTARDRRARPAIAAGCSIGNFCLGRGANRQRPHHVALLHLTPCRLASLLDLSVLNLDLLQDAGNTSSATCAKREAKASAKLVFRLPATGRLQTTSPSADCTGGHRWGASPRAVFGPYRSALYQAVRTTSAAFTGLRGVPRDIARTGKLARRARAGSRFANANDFSGSIARTLPSHESKDKLLARRIPHRRAHDSGPPPSMGLTLPSGENPAPIRKIILRAALKGSPRAGAGYDLCHGTSRISLSADHECSSSSRASR